jgi:hypothetical protein
MSGGREAAVGRISGARYIGITRRCPSRVNRVGFAMSAGCPLSRPICELWSVLLRCERLAAIQGLFCSESLFILALAALASSTPVLASILAIVAPVHTSILAIVAPVHTSISTIVASVLAPLHPRRLCFNI